MSITYSECVFVALVIQYEMHMCHVVIFGLPALRYFLTLSLNCKDFLKKVIEPKMCGLIFFTTLFPEIFLIIKRIRRDVTKIVYLSSCKIPVSLVRF